MTRTALPAKVQLDVVPPFSLVSAYRRGRGISGDGMLIDRGKKEKDEMEKTQIVLSCRKLLNEVRTFFQEEIHKKH